MWCGTTDRTLIRDRLEKYSVSKLGEGRDLRKYDELMGIPTATDILFKAHIRVAPQAHIAAFTV